jgi:hypothetical protein
MAILRYHGKYRGTFKPPIARHLELSRDLVRFTLLRLAAIKTIVRNQKNIASKQKNSHGKRKIFLARVSF